ncbi:hypothetical protein FRB99_008005 [Tulasnella sp. 403]|nr:hypothetical protein FRB99_008005 [Tulasnella sp. 403]
MTTPEQPYTQPRPTDSYPLVTLSSPPSTSPTNLLGLAGMNPSLHSSSTARPPKLVSHPPPPVPKHSNSTSSNSSDPDSVIGTNLLVSSGRPSTDSGRSSGEYTAVTIYSMYSDHRSSAVPPLPSFHDVPPIPVDKYNYRRSTSRPSSKAMDATNRDDNGHLSVGTSSAGRHASAASWSDFHRPTSVAVSSRRTSRARDSGRTSESPEPAPLPVPTTPGIRPTAQPSPQSSNKSPPPSVPNSPPRDSNAVQLLPVPTHLAVPPRRNSAASSSRLTNSSETSRSARTPSTANGPLLSENGEAEDVDSLYVRSTYARLEQTGVPGDGYEEGIERTRARAPGTMERRETIWGDQLHELSEQEVDFLSSLDRYGFKATSLSSRQENRLALLPVVPYKKLPATVRTPPSSPAAPPDELRTLPTPTEDPKERTRIAKWERMMKVSKRDVGGNVERWTFDERKGRKLRERVYKGIPDRWRSAVWWTVIDSSRVAVVCPPLTRTGVSNPPMSAEQLKRDYRDRVDRPSSHDIQIDLDVPRTISGHVMFHTRYGSGQRSLFHVLHVFSQLCPDCGYCQGMGPIAATLLCYLEPERAYVCMVRIHDNYDMHSIFSPGFPGLLESIYVQERLTEKLMPDVYASFKKHMISSTSYATKWYITLFANCFPFQTQLRLWDAFFLEGRDVIVIIALSIIWVLRVPTLPQTGTYGDFRVDPFRCRPLTTTQRSHFEACIAPQ